MPTEFETSVAKLFYYCRTSNKFPQTLKWGLFIGIFFQQFVISLDFGPIDEYYTGKRSFLRYLDYVITASTWIFESTNYFFQSLYLFMTCLSMTLFVVFLAKKVQKKERVPSIYLLVVKIWYQYVNNMFGNAISFRFAFIINLIIKGDHSSMTISSLVFISLALLLGINTARLSSIFLEHCNLSFQNALAVFDSHWSYILYVVRIIFLTLSAFANVNIAFYSTIIALIEIVLFAVIFYLRVILSVYNSSIASFIEVSPFFVHIPVFICRFIAKGSFLSSFIVYIVALIGYAIFHFIYTKKQRAHSIKFFFSCVSPGEDSSSMKMTRNMSSVLRIAAFDVATPELFEQFVKTVGVRNMRPEQTLEIARFLAAFTDKGEKVLKLLKECKKKKMSTYMEIQILYMTKSIKSLIYGASEHHLQVLDTIHRNYVVDMYKYWHDKANKQYFKVMFDSFRVAYNHFELINTMQYLIKRFPLDGNLRVHYADIIFLAFGEAKKSILNRRLGLKLKENSSIVENYVFSQYSKYNPYIIQDQTTNDTSELSSSTQSHVIRFHFDDEIIQIDDSTSLAAAYVQKSKSYVAIGNVFNALAAVIFIMAVYLMTYKDHVKIESNYKTIVKEFDNISDIYYNPLAATIMPYALSYQLNFDPTTATEEECAEHFDDVYGTILSNMPYYFLSTETQTKLASLIFMYINTFSIISGHHCDKIITFMENPGHYSSLSQEVILKHLNMISDMLNEMSIIFDSLYNIPYYLIYLVVTCIICVGFSVTVFFFFVNSKRFEEESFITDFMASPKRLVLLLLERSVDAWNLLHKLYPFPVIQKKQPKPLPRRITKTKPSVARSFINKSALDTRSFSPIPKQVDQQSHHINLSESKLSVSFIGQEEMGLIKRFQPSKLSRTESSNDINDTSETTAKSICEDSIDTGSQQKDILQTAIEETEESEGFKQNFMWLVIMIAPWVISFFTILCYIPAVASRRVVEKNNLNFNNKIIKNIMELTEAVEHINYFVSNNSNQTSVEHLVNIGKNISASNNELTKIVERKHCSTVHGSVRCHSYAQILNDINGVFTELGIFAPNYIASIMINSTINIWEYAIREAHKSLRTAPASEAFCFIFLVAITGVGIIVFFNYIERIGQSAINSLFHFPHQYFTQLETAKKLEKLKSQENNVITVSIFAKTGEIYSISNNVEDILDRAPFDFIGKEFKTEFKSIGDKQNLVQYTGDRKSRMLVCETISTGMLTQCALFERSSEQIVKKKEMEIVNSMVDFIPMKFAKEFCENGEETFYFNNSSAVLIRINTDEPIESLDMFFTKLNQIITIYPSADILVASYSMVLVVVSRNEMISDLLFVKDLLEGCSKYLLNISIIRDDIKAELKLDNEPFIYPIYTHKEEQAKITMKLPYFSIGIIGFSEEFLENVGTKESYNEMEYAVIPFQQYIDSIVNGI